jgi:hypothetical protein
MTRPRKQRDRRRAKRKVAQVEAVQEAARRNRDDGPLWLCSCTCGAAIASTRFEPQQVPCDQCGQPILINKVR